MEYTRNKTAVLSEEERQQLARLEVGVRMERKSLAERLRRGLAEKEEEVRVMKLKEHQLQEELMAEKERRLLEKEQQQTDMAKMEATRLAMEVRLAAGQAQLQRYSVARQENAEALAAGVKLHCQLAQTKEELRLAVCEKDSAVAESKLFSERLALLGNQIQARDAELLELRKELVEMDTELAAVEGQIEAKDEMWRETESQLNARAAETERALAIARGEAETRAGELQRKSVEIHRLQKDRAEELKIQQGCLEEAVKRERELQQEADQLSKRLGEEIEQRKKEGAAFQQDKARLAAALDAEKRATAAATAKAERLQAELSQQTEDAKQHMSVVGGLREDIGALLRVKEDLDTELAAQRITVAEVKKETKKQMSELAVQQSENTRVRKQKEELVAKLKAQLAAQTTATAEAEANAAVLWKAALEAEAALAVLREEALPLLHQEVLLLVGDAREREAVAKALEGSAEELTVTLPKETEANGEECARLCKLLLTRCQSLRKLCLKSATIGEEVFGQSIEGLVEGLAQNWTLRELSLMDGSFSDAGALLLLHALPNSSTLKVLSMLRCNVGDAGAEALAATLERNNSLQTLKLECSNISDAGAGFLASALERNGTLQVLDLWGTRVGQEGAALLAAALKENNSTLTHLLLPVRCSRPRARGAC